jgi:hypothetical protein
MEDVIERPVSYSELIQNGLDLPDVLRQITQDVRHLNSLKIVYTDKFPHEAHKQPHGRTAPAPTKKDHEDIQRTQRRVCGSAPAD